MDTYDRIIVGGGASGLISAARLSRDGSRVLLLEASERLGGCVQTWKPEPDFWLELGAHTAYNSYVPLLEALDERGRLNELLAPNKLHYRFLERSGRLQSPVARLNIAEAARSLPFGIGRSKAAKSVAEWYGGLLGKGNYRRLLSPAFAAVLSQPADAFPAAWLFRRKPRLKTAPRKFTFPGGLQALLEAIAGGARFTVRTGTPVNSLERRETGFLVQAGEVTLGCRQLLLAVPVNAAASLVATIYPELSRILQAYPMAESEALGVVLPAEKTRFPAVAGVIGVNDDYWSLVTRDSVPHPRLRGFVFHFRPGRLDRQGKLARAAAVLGVSPADFLHVAETLNHLPAPDVEHARRVADIEALIAHEPIALVGNYLCGMSIGDCTERAVIETNRLLGNPRPPN
jgi:protoporphyrinogen oxidase